MSSGATRAQMLTLYKALRRESQKISNYNFRSYALRRIKDAFTENKSLVDQKQITKEFNFAKENLELIKRQAVIGTMYQTEKLVIENQN